MLLTPSQTIITDKYKYTPKAIKPIMERKDKFLGKSNKSKNKHTTGRALTKYLS